MYSLYAEGATLEEVGARFGLTRERVRQIFQEAGIATRSIAETSALRHDRLLRQRGGEIRKALSKSGDVAAVSRQLDVRQTIVREVAERYFPSLARSSPSKKPRYTDAELIAFLQEAASASPGPLTVAVYTAYAKGRHTDDGKPWPIYQTHANRFGTWRKALAKANADPA